MEPATYDALRRIVITYTSDEAGHFAESGRPRKHIYRDLVKLAALVDIKLTALV